MQNALELYRIMDILDNPPVPTLQYPQTDIIQNDITCNNSLSKAFTDLSASTIPSTDDFPMTIVT